MTPPSAQRDGGPVVLRRACVEDVPDIMRIEAASFPTPWPVTAVRAELARDDGMAYYTAAVRDGVLVGYAGMWYVAGEGHILTIAVSPEHRRKGIGKALLVRLIDEVVERGGDRVYLEYRVSNDPARRLYEEFGFRRVQTRPNYYRDTGEDAIVVELDGLQSQDFAAQLCQWRRMFGAA